MAKVWALLRAAAIATFFVAAALGGVLLHLDVPSMRRVVAARVSGALIAALPGRVTIERIGSLGPTRFSGIDAHVDDPDGIRVLIVTGASIRVSTGTLLRSLFRGNLIEVDLTEAAIERASVNLDGDDAGLLRLVRAFVSAAREPSGGGPAVRLTIARALLGHVEIAGVPPGAPRIDADVDELEGSVRVSSDGFALEVAHAAVVARNALGKLAARGSASGRLARPSLHGLETGATISWRGTLGPVESAATAEIDGDALTAALDVPATAPDDIRLLWPSCPFTAPAAAHAEARGTLAALQIDARASVGSGVLVVRGPLTRAGTRWHATLHADATTIDANALSAAAPASNVAAAADVAFTWDAPGTAEGTYAVEFAGGTLGRAHLPAATIRGALVRGDDNLDGQADATIHEPGAPTDVSLRIRRRPGAFSISWDAAANVPQIDAVPRFAASIGGGLRAASHGTFDVLKGVIDADLEASGSDLTAGGVQLRAVTVKAHAHGPLPLPRVDADVRGEDLGGHGFEFAALQAEAHGAPNDATFQIATGGSGTELSANGRFSVVGIPTVRDASVTVEHAGIRAVARVALAQLSGPVLRVDDAVIHGLGTPLYATLRLSRAEAVVHAEGRGVDLGRIARFVNRPDLAKGRLSLYADATVRANGAQGDLKVDLNDAEILGWQGTRGHLDAKLEGRRASGRLDASIADVGSMELQSSAVEIGGAGPLVMSSWRDAWGALDVRAQIDLAKLVAKLPAGLLPVRAARGTLALRSRIARESAADLTPEVDVHAETTGFAAFGPVAKPWRVEGIDATVDAKVDANTGFTKLEATASDSVGVVLRLTASSANVPYQALLSNYGAAEREPLELARAMAFDATLAVPRRDLADLPAIFGTKGVHGLYSGTVEWKGAITRPSLDVHAAIERGSLDSNVLAVPLNLEMTAHYDGVRATGTVHGSTRKKSVLAADAAVDVAAADLVKWARGSAPAWKGAAHATLTEFPLHSVAALDERLVHGHASGEIRVDGLHDDARATVSLSSHDLKVGDVACPSTTWNVNLGSGLLEAHSRIEETDGWGELHANLGAHWGAALVPSIDTARPIDISFSARRLRAQIFYPVFSNLFDQLDGRLDADAHFEVDPRTNEVKPQGTITLRDGVIELVALGGAFHDASATATLTPDGIVRLTDVSAKGLSGVLQAAATLRFAVGGLAGARAVVRVSKRDPLPLVFDGVQVGTFDGQVEVTATPASSGAAGMDLDVDVATAHVQLPLATTHDVQSLGDLPAVQVGYKRPGGDFEPILLDGDDLAGAASNSASSRKRITVRLGNDVQVKRGTDLDVRLEGTTSVVADHGLHASGQIRLTRGTVEVQGKKFTIEDGSASFVDDPTNPQINMRASWQAPEGTIVYATFVGPLKTGKPSLSSDPQHNQTEILSLILFGTIDQATPGDVSQASPALGAAGGAAAAPINRALGGVNQMLDNFGFAGGITTKIDTSQASPRTDVELQIARDITLQVAWVFLPPPSAPDYTLFTLSWRFLRKWSVETTVGDAGTSILDLVWQHRY